MATPDVHQYPCGQATSATQSLVHESRRLEGMTGEREGVTGEREGGAGEREGVTGERERVTRVDHVRRRRRAEHD